MSDTTTLISADALPAKIVRWGEAFKTKLGVYSPGKLRYEPKVSLWVNLMWRLFPYRECRPPAMPAEFTSVIMVTALVRLSMADRLRVLASGRLNVSAKIACEHPVGRTRASAATSIERIGVS